MAMLERRKLGRTKLEVTRFGFGGAPMGERFVPVDNATADAVLTAACAAGINYFDTAPQYGQGKSEARIGRILQTRPRDYGSTWSRERLVLPDTFRVRAVLFAVSEGSAVVDASLEAAGY